ncbi:MAG: hypothetical protein FJY67_09210 [Calditrichaeota bacterium]|nr:hypothetical protein [Calditrichota bacterium]
MNEKTLSALAGLLRYPESDAALRLNGLRSALPAAALRPLEEFEASLAALSLNDRQELHVRTFDWIPDQALEVGWHLFGEDYQRGELMAYLAKQLREHNLDAGIELPDHLTNVLCLMEVWKSEEAGEFESKFLLPALDKLTGALRKAECPYVRLLDAIRETLNEERSTKNNQRANHDLA